MYILKLILDAKRLKKTEDDVKKENKKTMSNNLQIQSTVVI